MRTVSLKRAQQTKAAILDLARVTGWTHRTIANRAGCSLGMVDSWTRKKPKVVNELYLTRIYFATGAQIAPDGVFRDTVGDDVKRGKKIIQVNHPFSNTTFKRWGQRFNDEEKALTLVSGWSEILRRMFLAALPSNANQQSKLPLVVTSLREWSQTALKDFGLMARYEEIRDAAIYGNKPTRR